MLTQSGEKTSALELRDLLDALNNLPETTGSYGRQFHAHAADEKLTSAENRFAKHISEAMAKSNRHCGETSLLIT
jgi:hypothetical protein